jgi:hypothetical protein
MAFTQGTFSPVSSHGNSNSPNTWTYRTTDLKSEVSAFDYFAAKTPLLNDGDTLIANASDGQLIGAFTAEGDGFTVQPLIGGGSIAGNEVLITKVEDFENFDDDTVTLTPGHSYKILGAVDIGTRCIAYSVSVVLFSNGTKDNMLISSCPTAMITGDGYYSLRHLGLVATVGPIYDITCTAPAIFNFQSFTHAGDMGQITGFPNSVLFSRLGSFDTTTTALMLNGAWTRLEFDDVFPVAATIGAGETFINFDSAITITERILISRGYAIIDTGGTGYNFGGISGIGNESIQINDNNFAGDGDPVSGVTGDDNQVYFNGNVGLTDTVPNGIWEIVGNVTPTVIDTIGDSEVITATVVEISLQRFDLETTQNKLTSTGARVRAYNIAGSFVLETTASNQRIGAVVRLNGVDTSIGFTTTTSGSAGSRIENLSINGILSVSPDDFIEVAVVNFTSTDNITVLDAEFQLVSLNS